MAKLFTTPLLNRSGMTLELWQFNLPAVKKLAMVCLILILLGATAPAVFAQTANGGVKGQNSAAPSKGSAVLGQPSVMDSKWKGTGLYSKFKPQQEILHKRDAVSKHFQNSDGSVTAVISQAPVHYQKEGSSAWEDIRMDIRRNSTGKFSNFELAVTENIYQLYFSSSVDNGYLIHFASGDLQLGTNADIQLLSGDNKVIQTIQRGQASGEVSDNSLKYNNTYASAYDELKVGTLGLEHDVVLTQKPSFLNAANAATVGFREFVKLPAGWQLVSKSAPGSGIYNKKEIDAKVLDVIDAKGKVTAEFLAPVIREQNNRHVQANHPGKGVTNDDITVQTFGEFKVEYADGGAYITTCVPASWLNDADRQYPIVIDPAINCNPFLAGSWTGFSYNSTSYYCGNTLCGDNVNIESNYSFPQEGWAYFLTSSINRYATVSDVVAHYYVLSESGTPYYYLRAAGNSGNLGAASSMWNVEWNGTVYYSNTSTSTTGWFASDLGSSGASDLQSNLGAGSFGVAFNEYETSGDYYGTIAGWYYAISGLQPYVTVTYVDPCYNQTNGYGVYWGTVTPTCSAQSATTMASTNYLQWTATAGVTYNLSLSGSGWGALDITVYYNNGSAWAPLVNGAGRISVPPSSANLASSTTLLASIYNGTGCPPAWITSSAVLTYQIAPATTPAIAESPSGNVCTGGNVTYTASGITVGSFAYFQYQWNGTGAYSGSWGTTNPYTWVSGNPNNSLYVEAVSNNGGCTATSSPVSIAINAPSSTGSFVTSPIYSCVNGTLYNGSGTALTGEAITGYTGTINGWGWGTNTTTCSANTAGYPYSAGSANMNLNCCWPGVGSGSTDVIFVQVTNGACAAAQSCISVTANNMVAPTSASISPAGPVCAPTSGNITLSYTGGSGGAIPGGTLKWYSGSCGGTYLGSGQNLVVAAPSSTTTYYCAWVDPCGNLTTCASATFTVVVLPTVSAASYSICKNSTTTLSASVGGTWVSNNTSVATVSGNTVTGVGPGTATFTFTSTSSPFCTNTTPAVTVTALPTVSVTGPTSFCGGTTTTLSPTTGGTWVSNNTAVATVSGSTVTGTTAGGSTNFTFTSSTAPNCANTTANVTVTGLPTVFGVTGGGTYCLGSSSVVGLSGSQTGVNYQLVLNGSTNVGSPVAGTGSAISFGGQSTVGTYTVVATTVTNSCVLGMSGSAVVTMLSPNVNNTTPSSIGTNGGTMNGTD